MTTALSPLRPFARLIDMATGAVVATTTALLSGTSRTSKLDACGQMSLVVLLADPGDATGGALPAMQPFAATLLSGGGGPGLGTPTPLLLSLSLDGGTSYDTHKLVSLPVRDTHQGALILTESGDDVYSVYASVRAGGGHATAIGCNLADILGAAVDTIVPQGSPGIISSDSTLPYLAGLFNPVESVSQDVPGNAAWNSGARARLYFLPVLVAAVDFDIPATLDADEDNIQHAVAELVHKLDVLFLGTTGAHWVADASDAALNLARTFAGTVCDGSPTSGAPAGTFGLSNARTSGHAVSRALVIGSVGTASGLTFDGDTTATILDETTTAGIDDGASIQQSSNETLHGQCSFTGGSTDAGFPSGGTITALTSLNRISHDAAWATCLTLVALNVSDQLGGVYHYMGDGVLRPLNNSASLPVLDMTIDTHNNVIDIATPHGVYNRTTDITNTTAGWSAVGGLVARVTRLSGVPVASPADYVLYALASGNAAEVDGVYKYDPTTATAQHIVGAGYNGWVKLLTSDHILDMVSTDNHSFFFIDKADQEGIFLYDSTPTPHTTTKFALPAGVKALRLDRVTATVDTVYVATAGDDQAGYYISYTSAWGATGVLPVQLTVGNALKVNRFYGPNALVNVGAHALTVRIFAATDNGLWYATTNTPTATTDWHNSTDQSGLAGVALNHVTCGEYQLLLGRQTSRIAVASDTELYLSSNSGVQYGSVNRATLDLGPYFSGRVQVAASDLPTNAVQTVGPMASSPIGAGAGTHIQDTGAGLPTGWYWLRRLNGRMEWEYRLVNPSCPFTNLMGDQRSEITADDAMTTDTASSILAAIMKRWLAENSTPQTILTLPSSFTQTTAALRTLQPTQAVHVKLNRTLIAKSSTGAVIGQQYVSLDDDMYVLEHGWTLAEGGAYALTQTRVGTVLHEQAWTPDDVATSLQQQLWGIKQFSMRRARV